ncbi:type 1 fimbrial protein [Cronobacter universalis]|nr:type 1 fimbrial protein [Cronobacter universalis]
MKRKILMLYAVLGLVLLNCADAAEDNVHFSGALVSQPCTIPDADTDIKLDFGSVIKKSLYKYTRTTGKPFNIHLEDCNIELMKTVSVTFEGIADNELTTMLALDAVSTAKGVAIGIETVDGVSMPVNKMGPYSQLVSGSNTLTFNAYVQAAPSSITNGTLVEGDFSSTANFVLNYQ